MGSYGLKVVCPLQNSVGQCQEGPLGGQGHPDPQEWINIFLKRLVRALKIGLGLSGASQISDWISYHKSRLFKARLLHMFGPFCIQLFSLLFLHHELT
jgi:hypothetical protein